MPDKKYSAKEAVILSSSAPTTNTYYENGVGAGIVTVQHDASDSKKLLVKLSGGPAIVDAGYPSYRAIKFLFPDPVGSQTTGGVVGDNPDYVALFRVRVKAILEDFEPSEETWNSHSALSVSASVGPIQLGAHTGSDTSGPSNTTELSVGFTYAIPLTIYGLMIESYSTAPIATPTSAWMKIPTVNAFAVLFDR